MWMSANDLPNKRIRVWSVQRPMKMSLAAICRSLTGGTILLIAAGASAQNLYVAVNTPNGLVTEIGLGGTQNSVASGFDVPYAMAFNSAGDLFVSDEGVGDITEITPTGVKSTFATGLQNPWGLTFNSAGDLFVANYTGNDITEITPNGTQSTFATGLDGPAGMAFNSAGDLFVADPIDNDILKITPSGTKTVFASGLEEPLGLTFLPVVPEPSVLGLFGIGAATLLLRRGRRIE